MSANRRLSHVASAVFRRPWFIRPEYLETMGALVELHLSGGRLSADEIQDRLDGAQAAAGPRRGARTSGAVAVIPIYGMIAPRATLMTEMSGGTTVEAIRSNFRQALADESVGSILFDVDSPGGYTDGIEELATEIRNARGQKPMLAIADYGMASAAYYLGCQCDEVWASPSSMVGWVGTALIHTEFSKQDQAEGVTTTIVRDPPGKMSVNEYEPLTEAALEELQAEVGDFSAQFFAAAAAGRGVSVAKVKTDFGQGGGMTAGRAKAAGLVDRVGTFDEAIARLATGKVAMHPATQALGGTYRVLLAERLELVDAGADPAQLLAPIAPMDEGGTAAPANDPEPDGSGEAGTPPADALDELALEGAIAARSKRRRARAN